VPWEVGDLLPEIDAKLRAWLDRQRVLFAATAPNDPSRPVSIAAHAADAGFSVLGPLTVAYSGADEATAANLSENERIVVTFAAFEGGPRIVRLHGSGRLVDGARSIVEIQVTRASESCGFVVPVMEYAGERDGNHTRARPAPAVSRSLSDEQRAWVARQHLFFVATAPTGGAGHVNLSPKGAADTFKVLERAKLAYVDLFGSGIETVAHLKENGRVTVMLCSFDGSPRIIRADGRGAVIEQGDPGYRRLRDEFDLPERAAVTERSIVIVDLDRVSDERAAHLPAMTFARERDQLFRYAAGEIRKGGPTAIRDYCDVNNAESIDKLAGLRPFGARVTDAQRRARAHEGRKL